MLLAIDLTNLGHVQWHAVGAGAAESGMRRIRAVVQHYKPTQVICGVDSSHSFRRSIDPSYKANRRSQDRPPELYEQIDRLVLKCQNAGYEIACREGFEADDILASAADWAVRNSLQIVLWTLDKDCVQCLIQGRVTILRKPTVSGGEVRSEWLNAEQAERKYGVRPDQFVDYQCLIGDTSDGMPGLAGFGPKTAVELLAFGDLRTCLLDENRWKLPLRAGLVDRLFASRERIEHLRQIFTLRSDACQEFEASNDAVGASMPAAV